LVFAALVSALPFQIGDCQRAIYIRGIAASQPETPFPGFTELVVVGREGKRKRIWGQQETKVTRAGSKGRHYQNIDFFRNLLEHFLGWCTRLAAQCAAGLKPGSIFKKGTLPPR
jgi:hypothetical protein